MIQIKRNTETDVTCTNYTSNVELYLLTNIGQFAVLYAFTLHFTMYKCRLVYFENHKVRRQGHTFRSPKY